MKHYQTIKCPDCDGEKVCKNGHSRNGSQRFLCQNETCETRSFQLNYKYNAHKRGIKEQIEEQTLNSSGVRDISRNLRIAPKTVTSHLKKKEPKKVNPYVLDKKEVSQYSDLEVNIYYSTEWDDPDSYRDWSFVGNKGNQRWTWYIVERKSGVILAWENGKRKDEVLKKLLQSVEHLPIVFCFTDDWGAYKRLFPAEYQHIIGKDNTWKIERKNLNFRTHIKRLNRKTICFSKSR